MQYLDAARNFTKIDFEGISDKRHDPNATAGFHGRSAARTSFDSRDHRVDPFFQSYDDLKRVTFARVGENVIEIGTGTGGETVTV